MAPVSKNYLDKQLSRLEELVAKFDGSNGAATKLEQRIAELEKQQQSSAKVSDIYSIKQDLKAVKEKVDKLEKDKEKGS